jgi:hypothetical protein
MSHWHACDANQAVRMLGALACSLPQKTIDPMCLGAEWKGKTNTAAPGSSVACRHSNGWLRGLQHDGVGLQIWRTDNP